MIERLRGPDDPRPVEFPYAALRRLRREVRCPWQPGLGCKLALLALLCAVVRYC
jgi:hypothetical protein